MSEQIASKKIEVKNTTKIFGKNSEAGGTAAK